MSSRADPRRRDRSWERDDRERDRYHRRDAKSSAGGGRRGESYRDEPRRRSSRSRSPRRDRDDRRGSDRRDRDYRREDSRRDGPSDREERRPDDRRRGDEGRDSRRDGRHTPTQDDKNPHDEDTKGRPHAKFTTASSSHTDTIKRTTPSFARPQLDPDASDHHEDGEAKDDVQDDDDAVMMAMMGLGGFGTTKGQQVAGNQEGGVNIKKERTWRQYMNRRGGFNRPLDKIK